MSVKQFFKHPITMRNETEIQNLLAEDGVKAYGQYMLLLEFLAERYALEGKIKVECNHNQLATLLRCKPFKVVSLLECFQNKSIIKVEQKQNKSIIECVNLANLFGYKRDFGHKSRLKEIKLENIKEEKKRAPFLETFLRDNPTSPSGRDLTQIYLDILGCKKRIKLVDVRQDNYPLDPLIEKHFTKNYLKDHFMDPIKYYKENDLKCDVHEFWCRSMIRTLSKFEDEVFVENKEIWAKHELN